ncbi:MAG: hypothetical protein ACR2MA_05150 [Egibacteraceae bacterium]
MRTTHEVGNQPPPLIDWDVSDYAPLREALQREGAGWYAEELSRLGRLAGGHQAQRWAAEADANPPRLRTHDRFGHRIDEVDYHPAYHELMRTSVGAGLSGGPWSDDFAPAEAPIGSAHVARAAGFFAWCHTELGHGCPGSMTHAVIPALRLLRAAQRTPETMDVFFDEVARPPAATPGSTPQSPRCARSWSTLSIWSRAPAGSAGWWSPCSRLRCWSATPRAK